MKRYATLSANYGVMEVYSDYETALAAAKADNKVAYVRPLDEEATQWEMEPVVDFGNCHAFAIK